MESMQVDSNYPGDLQSLCNELLLQARQQKQQQQQQHQIHRPVPVTTAPATTSSSASGNTLYYHPQTISQSTIATSTHDQYNVYQAHKLKIPIAMLGSIDHHHQQQQTQSGIDAATIALQLLEQQMSSPRLTQLAGRNIRTSSNLCSLTLLSPPGTNQPASAAPASIAAPQSHQSSYQNIITPSHHHHHKSAFEFTSPTPTTPFSILPVSPAIAATNSATSQQLAAAAAAVDALLMSANFNNANGQLHSHQRSLSDSSSATTPYTAAGLSQSKKFNIDSILSEKSHTEALAFLVEQINRASTSSSSTLDNENLFRQNSSSCTTLTSPHSATERNFLQQQHHGSVECGTSGASLFTAQMATQQQQAAMAAVAAQQQQNQHRHQMRSPYATTISDLINNSQQYLQSNISGGVVPQSLSLSSYTSALYLPNKTPALIDQQQHQQFAINVSPSAWQTSSTSVPAADLKTQYQIPNAAARLPPRNNPRSSSSILRRQLQLENENNNNLRQNSAATHRDDEEAILVIDNDSDDHDECLADLSLIVDEQQAEREQNSVDDAINNNKNNNKSRHRCNDCRKVYSTFSGLVKHREHHCTALHTHQHKCHFCQKDYNTIGALKMHIKTHTLPCKCPDCGKAFSRPWLLQGHLRTHSGVKPFSCEDCDRSFADRSNLRAHQQTHAIIKKYKCVDCLKTFSRLSLLNKHRAGTACKQRLLRLHQQQQQNSGLLTPLVCQMDL